MNITVFGANGRVGSQVVARLLDKGHSVTAFVHGESRLDAHDRLQVVNGDIYNRSDVDSAISGSQVVVSALGSWGTPKKDILTEGMKNIIPSMEQFGVSRIVSLTGQDARDLGDKPNLIARLFHMVLLVMAPKILKDGENHIELLRSSSLNWTVIRSPIMNDKGTKGSRLVFKLPAPWATINRGSVVLAMVDQVSSEDYYHSSPFIVRN